MNPAHHHPTRSEGEAPPPQLALHVLTVSPGPRTNTTGTRAPAAGANPVAVLAEILRDIPASLEGWWSPHTWEGDRRSGRRWVGACAIALDLDYHDRDGRHAEPALEARDGLRTALGNSTGNLFHDTPRGARLVFVLDRPTADREAYARAVSGASVLLGRELEDRGLAAEAGRAGFAVDHAANDFARFLYAPRAIVRGQARQAEILVIREQPFSLAGLEALAPLPAEQPERTRIKTGEASLLLNDAVRRWNEDHAQDWGPPGRGECPACGHHGCFGRLPEVPEKWTCFSSGPDGHEARTQGRCGRLGSSGQWFGDALDLEAFNRGVARPQILRQDGYLAARSHAEPEPP